MEMIGSAESGVTFPHVTVILPTRNRPADVQRCLESLSRLDYPRWDVILVDQSEDAATQAVVEGCLGLRSRLRYLRMAEAGKSRAFNRAWQDATSDVVAIMDDDCVVDPDWLESVAGVFQQYPDAGIVQGRVISAVDTPDHFVPTYEVKEERVLRGARAASQIRTMGASMCLRRGLLDRVGPFDVLMGPGAPFHGGDDWEYVYRALASGHSVVETPAVTVRHHGARSVRQGAGSRLAWVYAYARGAADMKMLRCGHKVALGFIAANVWYMFSIIRPLNFAFRRGPTYATWLIAYLTGLIGSFQAGVDRERCLYVSRQRGKGAMGESQ